MKKLLAIGCLFLATSAVANPNNLASQGSLLFKTIEENPSAYQATLNLLCPEVEKLATQLYSYADWGVGFNTAMVHVRKRFYKMVPEGTNGRATLELQLENEVEYILVSHKQQVSINEVIETSTEACWSTFEGKPS